MTSTPGRARSLAVEVIRSTTLILVALLVILVLFPAVLGAAGPQVSVGG